MFVSNAHTIVQYCINGIKQMNDPTDGKQWYSCPTKHTHAHIFLNEQISKLVRLHT